MPHQGFNTFSNACERFVFSIATNGPLTQDEAEIVEYYCKEILSKVASSQRPPAIESAKTFSPGPGGTMVTELFPAIKEKRSA
jgi:hypothetical protein